METERVLAKLRRLRYQSDYPLRLFLAAMGEGPGPADEGGAGAGRKRGGAGPGRPPSRAMWHLGSGRCPRCGHLDRESARRRARVN